ncbi:MAG TPA: hypothetical protein PK593_08900 [Thermomicrobiales bacterium]|nr:hypothetical protein [Thermomicrobiales bacterium]HQZ89894.1 hypothetical protein [Thermomicrobiales bacterium]HRA31264.1 hypothetical protein [Thermomicrobiales bacterium]
MILELIKAAIQIGGLILLLLIFPILFLIVFGFATSLDRTLERGDE